MRVDIPLSLLSHLYVFYVVLDRKPRKKDFQFYSGNFNKLILLDFFNPKSAIKNPKSCVNGLFVQALYKYRQISLD